MSRATTHRLGILSALEARLAPAYSLVESAALVTFTSDGAAGSLALTTAGNQIRYSVNGGPPVALTQATAGTLAKVVVNGGTGNETIDLSGLGAGLTAMETLRGGAVIAGGGGDDFLLGTQFHDTLTGGAGADQLFGNGGDDLLQTRDEFHDSLEGGRGHDSANFESLDTPTGCEIWNPMPTASANRLQKVKVLAINYDPTVPSQGNKHLYELFGWNRPQDLAAGYKESLERTSGGAVRFEITEWRDINEIPAFEDGFQYTPDQYYQNRLTNSNWHTQSTADVRKIFRDQAVVPLIDAGRVDEVWFFGDHYFSIGGEAFMAGPGAFFINGPVYADVPAARPFACYGFSYERGVPEMLHNTGHRVENHGNRTWGYWNLASPQTAWDKFSANATQSKGAAGVGTTHYPPNALSDYDYGNATVVQTWADDFLDYPEFTGAKRPANRDAWRRNSGTTDDHRAYLEWYFHRLPRGAHVNADGRQNNWWKYVYDYANYTPAGQPLPLRASLLAPPVVVTAGDGYTFRVAYSSPMHVRASTLDGSDVRVTGPNGFDRPAQLVAVSDAEDGPYRVATYRVEAPGGSWEPSENGTYALTLQAGQVSDGIGTVMSQSNLGTFRVIAAGTPLTNRLLAVAAGPGGGPHVKLYRPDGILAREFFAYAAGFTGGVAVATGDIDGDGTDDVATAPASFGGPHVRVFSGATGQLLREFFAYAPSFFGGLSLTVGDVNGDGRPDLITAPASGGGPHVRVFSGANGAVLGEFFAYGPSFVGGVNLAATDFNGDRRADIVTAPASSGGPHVKLFNGAALSGPTLREFFAFAPSFTGGLSVAAGDVDGDGKPDVVTSAGPGGGPHVQAFNLAAPAPTAVRSFFAFDAGFLGGVRVATLDRNGDGRHDFLAVPAYRTLGLNPPLRLRAFDSGGALAREIEPFPGFLGGLYVG